MSEEAEKSTNIGGARQRRKEARPSEIVEVAIECFLENGFEATKLDEVARRSGIAKGTIYLYFETKEQLFRAVVQHVISSNLKDIEVAASTFDGSLTDLVPAITSKVVKVLATSRAPALARLILREADRFPDLARVWFEDVATPVLSSFETILKRAQASGEIREGDPRLQVFSILGPLTAGILFSELVERLGYEGLDLERLASQHANIVLHGLVTQPNSSADKKS